MSRVKAASKPVIFTKSFVKDMKIIHSTSANSSSHLSSTSLKNRPILPGWGPRWIMESHSYLADESSYYRLPFLSKSNTLKLLYFGRKRQRWYPEAERASFFSSSHSMKSNLIPLPVYLARKRDEEEERKSLRGAPVVLTSSFLLPPFVLNYKSRELTRMSWSQLLDSGGETYKSHVALTL